MRPNGMTLTKSQRAHLELVVASGGTYVIRGGPLAPGRWNRTCAAFLRKEGLITQTPGSEGVPPAATITVAGLEALAIREAA